MTKSSLMFLTTVIMLTTGNLDHLSAQQGPLNPFWTAGKVEHEAGTAAAKVVSADPRPLWMALNALEREYGWVIDYDDPIYSQAETTAQNNPQFESRHPGKVSRMPSGTTFETTFTEPAGNANSPVAVISKIVTDYNASGNPGHFEVRADAAGNIEVVGSSSFSANQIDILNTFVEIPAGEARSLDALQSLTNALTSSTGIKVVLGTIPFNVLMRAHVNISPPGSTSARILLQSISDSGNVQLMWDLLYDYDSQSYFLNLRPRSIIATDLSGNKIIVHIPQSSAH